MEDDDLADQTQRLLDALNEFLANGKVVSALGASDVSSLKKRRDQLTDRLLAYRVFGGFTERRTRQPATAHAGPRQGATMPVMVAAVSARAVAAEVGAAGLAGGEAAAGGLSIAAVLAEIILPIGAAVAAAAALSALTGGSLREVAARKLKEAAQNLMRDLTELSALATILAITAEEAARLSLGDLWAALIKAVASFRGAALAVLIAELLRRFPQCAEAIRAFEQAAKRIIQNVRSGVPTSPTGAVKNLANLKDAQDALKNCILGAATAKKAGP